MKKFLMLIILTAGINNLLLKAQVKSSQTSDVKIVPAKGLIDLNQSNPKKDTNVFSNTSCPAGALNFNGINNYVSVPNLNHYFEPNRLTFEAWIKRARTNFVYPQDAIFASRDDYGWGISIYDTAGHVAFTLVSISAVLSTITISDTLWHHVAVTYDGGLVKFYIDGNNAGAVPYNVLPFNTAGEYGIGFRPASPRDEHFLGSIDELRVWNRVLSQAEINASMNSYLDLSECGLIGYYRFDQGIANGNNTGINILYDNSGNNINGQMQNFSLNGNTSNWVEGKINAACLTSTVSGVNTCSGNSIGSASVIATGGVMPYTYLWSNGSTMATINGLSAGTYFVTVSDANANFITDSVTIKTSFVTKPIISASGGTTNLCPGKNVTLTSSAASSYLWSTGATTQSIIVKKAGNYTVTVSNTKGCTNTADATNVTFQGCGKPKGLATNNITASSAKIIWQPVTCAVGYQYEWRKKGTSLWLTGQTAGTSKTITGLTGSTTYLWRVITACNISPDTITSKGYTNGQEFTTLAATSNSNISNDAMIGTSGLNATLYPNPTKERVTIIISNQKGQIEVSLSDLQGKLLWRNGKTANNKISIPIELLTPGLYLVTISDEKEKLILKLVKE